MSERISILDRAFQGFKTWIVGEDPVIVKESKPLPYPDEKNDFSDGIRGSNIRDLRNAEHLRVVKGGSIIEYTKTNKDGRIVRCKGVYGFPELEGEGHVFFPTDLQPTPRLEDDLKSWEVTGAIPEKLYDELLHITFVDKAANFQR